jgi:hypothetical protein
VTQRLRAFDPESGEWHWLEFEDDGEPLRHIVFSGDRPIVAGRIADRLECRDMFGIPGDEFYEAVYGAMTYTNLLDAQFPPDAVAVTAEEFDRVFGDAQGQLRRRRITTGRFAEASRVRGTFEEPPWPRGRTGVPVTLEDGLPGFVDAIWFFRAGASWPEPGTRAEFEISHMHGLQIRLRPTATPTDGPDWPQPYTW